MHLRRGESAQGAPLWPGEKISVNRMRARRRVRISRYWSRSCVLLPGYLCFLGLMTSSPPAGMTESQIHLKRSDQSDYDEKDMMNHRQHVYWH
jgi:hypothetical protein